MLPLSSIIISNIIQDKVSNLHLYIDANTLKTARDWLSIPGAIAWWAHIFANISGCLSHFASVIYTVNRKPPKWDANDQLLTFVA